MKYKAGVKESVRTIRAQGVSLLEIHRQTSIPLTTIHDWVRDIQLSEEQKRALINGSQEALQQGRKRAAAKRKVEGEERRRELLKEGKARTDSLTNRELFIAGVALYWAEGFKNKHEHRLGFCNSDPAMIKFYLLWLEKCLKIQKQDIVLRLTLNEVYRERVGEFEQYWSEFLNIPISQFTKPFYQKSIWKRQYNTDTYRGVLRVHVKDSLKQLLLMKGWLEGLKLDRPG